MCRKSLKISLALLVLALVSVQLFAWSPRLVGPDSKSLVIHNQEVMIESLETEREELLVAIKLKDKEIATLQSALDIAQSDLSLQGIDSEAMLKLVSELKNDLATAQSDLKKLKGSQEISIIELAEVAGAVEVSQEILETVPNDPSLFGGIIGLGGVYNPDGSFDVGIDAGVSYGMFGLTVGVQTKVGPITSMIDPTKFSYKAGLQVNF